MNDQNADAPRQVPLRDIDPEPLVDALLRSGTMTPYLSLMAAVRSGKEAGAAREALAALRLEKRYVWRVASALKWAFEDLEMFNVEADCQTLSAADQERLVEGLTLRPLQFCLFLSALIGPEQMESLMLEAIRVARADSGSGEPL